MKRVMLIIDENEIDRYISTMIARKSGEFDQVYSLNNGEEAYLYLSNQAKSEEVIQEGFYPPSVIVLDLNMSGMSGFEFLQKYSKLKECNGSEVTFVAMLSPAENNADTQKALKFSCVKTFITKPFRKDHIPLILQEMNTTEFKEKSIKVS